MNKVGESINVQEITKGCRQMDLTDLMYVLRNNISRFWSWGSHAFRIDRKGNVRMFRMAVNGRFHSGHVYIFLNGLDLFDVYLTSSRGTIKRIQTDLYNDMLTDWIDIAVEKIGTYKH